MDDGFVYKLYRDNLKVNAHFYISFFAMNKDVIEVKRMMSEWAYDDFNDYFCTDNTAIFNA